MAIIITINVIITTFQLFDLLCKKCTVLQEKGYGQYRNAKSGGEVSLNYDNLRNFGITRLLW